MTEAKTTAGFTIIEVVLFLAISGMMIAAAMLAVNGRTEAVQYSDATRATESFFESRLSRTRNGTVDQQAPCRYTGGGSTGYTTSASDGSCIFLGYLYGITPATDVRTVEVYQVFGQRISTDDPCISGLTDPRDVLSCVDPQAVPVDSNSANSIEVFDIPWGMKVTTVQNNGADITRWGYLRNPVGQDIIPVAFIQGAEADINNATAYRVGYGNSFVADEFDVLFCMTNDKKPAAIQLGGSNREFDIEALFDDADDVGCTA